MDLPPYWSGSSLVNQALIQFACQPMRTDAVCWCMAYMLRYLFINTASISISWFLFLHMDWFIFEFWHSCFTFEVLHFGGGGGRDAPCATTPFGARACYLLRDSGRRSVLDCVTRGPAKRQRWWRHIVTDNLIWLSARRVGTSSVQSLCMSCAEGRKPRQAPADDTLWLKITPGLHLVRRASKSLHLVCRDTKTDYIWCTC